jgi:hypothetical protein
VAKFGPPNTPAGTNVSTQANGGATTPGGATITFSNVTASGETTMTTTTNGPAPPSGFQLGNPPTWFDIDTTATFTGAVTICINYGNVSFNNENNLKLMHLEGSTWKNVTTSKDTVNNIICGSVTSFSFFVIAEDTASSPTVTITASDPTASEPGTNKGQFTVTRAGPTSAKLLVEYSVGGTAKPRMDYVELSGRVTIPAGQTSATITVTPKDDHKKEGTETVKATLVPHSRYVIGTPGMATVNILDND